MGYAEAQYTVDEVVNALQQMGANESGIPPVKPWVTVVPAAQSVKIYFTIKDTVIENQTVCHCKGVMIRKKLGSPITSLTDGDLVGIYEDDAAKSHGPEGTPITISGLENGVWVWIGVWAFSDHNVYNLDMSNIYQVQPGVDIIYGFHQDFTDLNPLTSITYIGANVNFEPMYTRAARPLIVSSNSTDSSIIPTYNPSPELRKAFTYGSWKTWSWLNAVQPFFLEVKPTYQNSYKYRGKKKYRLSSSNYLEDADTGNAVDEMIGFGGQGNKTAPLYAWIPRIYIKEVYSADGNSRDVYFSETKLTSATNDFVAMGFQNPNNEEIKGFWLGMNTSNSYHSSVYTVNMPYYSSNSSGSYGLPNPFSSQASDFRKMLGRHDSSVEDDTSYNGLYEIAAYGGVWHSLIRDLCYLLYRSTDIQECAGYGPALMSSGSYNNSNRILSSISKFDDPKYTVLTMPNLFFSHGPFYGVDGASRTYGSGSSNYRAVVGGCKIFHNFALMNCWIIDPNIVLKNKNRVYICKNGYYDYIYSQYTQTNVYIDAPSTSGSKYPSRLVYLGKGLGSFSGNVYQGSTDTGLCDLVDYTDKSTVTPSTSDRIIFRCGGGVSNGTPTKNAGIESIGIYTGVDKPTDQSYMNWPSEYGNSIGWIPIVFPPTNYTPYDDYEGGVPSQW